MKGKDYSSNVVPDLTSAEYYVVTVDLRRAPLADYLMHGYQSRWDFEKALRRLANNWKDRVGQCINKRHGFMLLRFHDTPGCRPDEEWFPQFLLLQTSMPEYLVERLKEPDPGEQELDEAFGFD
jgi:hypothetical protein